MDKIFKKCIFVGHDSQHRGYRLYSPLSREVFISKDVKLNETPMKFSSFEDLDDFDGSYIVPK